MAGLTFPALGNGSGFVGFGDRFRLQKAGGPSTTLTGGLDMYMRGCSYIFWQALGRIECLRLRETEGSRINLGWSGMNSILTSLDSIYCYG